MARTNKSDYDPREAAGLVRAIKKRNLEELLDKRGISHAKLAELSGKDKSNISKWICGERHMSNADLLLISKVLDVSPLYILDLTTDEWPEDLAKSHTGCNRGPTVGRSAIGAYLCEIAKDDFHLSQLLDYDEYDRACITVGGYTFYNHMNGRFESLWLELDVVDREHRMMQEHGRADLYRWACDRGAVVRRLMHEHFDGWIGDYRDLGKLSKDAIDFYLNQGQCFPASVDVDLIAQSVTGAGRHLPLTNAELWRLTTD